MHLEFTNPRTGHYSVFDKCVVVLLSSRRECLNNKEHKEHEEDKEFLVFVAFVLFVVHIGSANSAVSVLTVVFLIFATVFYGTWSANIGGGAWA